MAVRVIERDVKDRLGEGLMWSPSRQRLFWVDIQGPALHWYDPDSDATGSLPMPEPIGWAIERAGSDGLVVGLKSGFAFLDLASGALTAIGDPEPERPHNRLNDAKADRWGRIWAGSKDDRDEDASGALYRLDQDLRWSRHDDGYGVTNGPTFSLDGRTLYHTDSAARTVHAFTLDAHGMLTDKRLFITFAEEWGYPDGMTTDADGGLWIAHWGGGRISRFHADGRLDRSIAMPATNITNICFGGKDLDRMFVTSSGDGMAHEPLAGALFEVDSGARGLPAGIFEG
jgi:sugar lactone lactonase YvrE